MMRGSAWKKEEDEFLRRWYPTTMPLDDIAEALGRSRNAVLGRAHRLGLRREHKDADRNYTVRVRVELVFLSEPITITADTAEKAKARATWVFLTGKASVRGGRISNIHAVIVEDDEQ
jgi:hypothetical protein